MEQDWSGGFEPELDGQLLAAKPADPEMRESASLWLFEENGDFALNRIGLEAVGATWDTHRCDANFAFRGGRVLAYSQLNPSLPVVGPDGRASILGAKGLIFECIEPNRKWRVRFDDEAREGRVEEQILGTFGGAAGYDGDQQRKRTRVAFDVELTMAAPCWTQDFRPEMLARLSELEQIDAGLMGLGWRLEQTCRGEGTLTIDGQTRSFKATGNRIHRQSIRPMGAFRGHCWQAAVFPDGRAFGLCTYPPRADGTTYNDAFVYQDGRKYKAKARNAAFLSRIQPSGADVAVELESDLGMTRIAGITTLSTFHMGQPEVNGMNLQQGAVRYEWDGLSTMGMIERSIPMEQCTIHL
jgi:hypothetical protein